MVGENQDAAPAPAPAVKPTITAVPEAEAPGAGEGMSIKVFRASSTCDTSVGGAEGEQSRAAPLASSSSAIAPMRNNALAAVPTCAASSSSDEDAHRARSGDASSVDVHMPDAPGTPHAGPQAVVDAQETNMDDEPEPTPEEVEVVSAVPLPESVQAKEEFWELRMAWSGKVYEMTVGGNDMVYDFRHRIEQLTNVPPARQKLIGLAMTKGKLLSADMDGVRFGTLGVKKGIKFTMVGTPEKDSFRDRQQVGGPELMDDFDVTYPTGHVLAAQAVSPADDPRNKRKVEEVIKTCPITVMNAPREGKRLLVLDLDYTILDTKALMGGILPVDMCSRPGLHDFLERVYEHYDIVVWSQTHWRWLESKLVEMGVIGGDRNYKVSFVADRTSMFPVFTQRDGQAFKHEALMAKGEASGLLLGLISTVTIHIDDLSRNFALNPGEGLKIRAFKNAGTLEAMQDRELIRLGRYLVHLALKCNDFTGVNHSRWKTRSNV